MIDPCGFWLKPNTPTPTYERPGDSELASEVEERDIEWLVPGVIPAGMLTLVAGMPGAGKSLYTAWLAAKVSSEGSPVLFSNVEDLRAETSKPRLRVAGADLDKVYFWTPILTTPEGVAQLEAFVNALGIRLLVLDPVSAHYPKGSKDDRETIGLLIRACERTGLAVVAVDHTRKSVSKSSTALESVLGSGHGLQAAARFVYVFGVNPKDPDERVLASAKSNVAERASMSFIFDLVDVELSGRPSERPRFVLTDESCGVSANDVVRYKGDGGDGGGSPVKKAIAAEWLTSYLMFGCRPAIQLQDDATKSGISSATIRRASTEMKIAKVRANGGGVGSFVEWALPAGHPALKVGDAAKAAIDLTAVTPGQLTVEDVLRMIDAGKGGGASGNGS